MHLICLKCNKPHSIILWAMRRMTYKEYSYCAKCYKEKEGKGKRLFAKLFTKEKR
jgi:hypothetical protein